MFWMVWFLSVFVSTKSRQPHKGDGKGVQEGRSELEFLGLRGRTYTVEASADMTGWKAVKFGVAGEAASTTERDRYMADDVKPVRVRVGPGATAEDRRFFRGEVH